MNEKEINEMMMITEKTRTIFLVITTALIK